jgi:uncharacterized protein YrrD
MNLVRARDVMGLPVVSISSGEDVAEIRDVVYDGEAHRLIGFTLNKRGRFAGRLKAVLAADSVGAIGPDAVMVATESAIGDTGEPSSDLVDLFDLGDARPVIGNRVLSADGTDLGAVVAVIISTGDVPCAVGYELQQPGRDDTSFVPISAQMALSGENLVLPAESTAFVRNDLAGFGAAIASYRSPALEKNT